MIVAPPGSYSEGVDDDLFDDVASNKADGGGDLSDSDLRLALDDSPDGTGTEYPRTSFDDTPIQDIPPPLNDDDDELPVVELRVNDEDKIVSD